MLARHAPEDKNSDPEVPIEMISHIRYLGTYYGVRSCQLASHLVHTCVAETNSLPCLILTRSRATAEPAVTKTRRKGDDGFVN